MAEQKVAAAAARPQIFVLAGCNGAGRSSLGGQAFQAAGIPYFNPDLAAREAIATAAALGRIMTQGEANAWAWEEGVARLRRAIAQRGNYALATTLGGDTIVGLLMEATAAGRLEAKSRRQLRLPTTTSSAPRPPCSAATSPAPGKWLRASTPAAALSTAPRCRTRPGALDLVCAAST